MLNRQLLRHEIIFLADKLYFIMLSISVLCI